MFINHFNLFIFNKMLFIVINFQILFILKNPIFNKYYLILLYILQNIENNLFNYSFNNYFNILKIIKILNTLTF